MNVLQNRKFNSLCKVAVVTSLVFSFAISSLSVAGAESATPIKDIRTEAKTARKEVRATATSTRRAIIQNTQGQIKDLRSGMSKDTKASTTAAIKAVREGRKDALQTNRASTTAAIKNIRASTTESIKMKRDDLAKEIAKRKDDKKKRLDQKARGLVEKAISNIYSMFNDKIARLNRVDANVTAKISTLKSKGADVSNPSALLLVAQTSLEKAKVNVQATASLVREQAATSTSKEILKDLVKTAEASIKTSAENYRKVAESIKAITPENESERATSTTVQP